MNEHMRVSDADRERVTERLREHFAEGRLTSDELDERISATLNAKTSADLRAVMTDLPEPEPAGPQQGAAPAGGWNGGWGGRPVYYRHRGPRLLPLALLALFAILILPGAGFVVFAFLKIMLLFWLVACVAGLLAFARFRRRARRYWR